MRLRIKKGAHTLDPLERGVVESTKKQEFVRHGASSFVRHGRRARLSAEPAVPLGSDVVRPMGTVKDIDECMEELGVLAQS